MENRKIALEGRLRRCTNVLTIGVKTNFFDYSKEIRKLILEAKRIYYPAGFYADIFNNCGKETFPSYHTYKYGQDKVKQTALFNLLNLPHPATRVFYGKTQQLKIPDYYDFPFIAKSARGSAMGRGVYFIDNQEALFQYLQNHHLAYIQEYLPIKKDIRVVVIGSRPVLAYWRIPVEGEFRSNVSLGGRISFDDLPEEAVELALHTAQKCGFDDVGIDICFHNGRYYVLEANMKYGKQGFLAKGIDYVKMMEKMIDDGEI